MYTLYTMAKKSTTDLDQLLTIRVSAGDLRLLGELTDSHAYAKRGTIARDALRRGLEAIQAEKKEVTKRR